MSTAPSQTAAANQARRKRTEDKLRAVADAIQHMQRRRLPVTYPAIASRAGVSRTFLYDNPAARDLISAAIARTATRRQHDQADRDAQAEASSQQRALNAEQALKTAHAEIRAQRARIGELLGELRDTQREYDHDALQRLTAENTTLKQRLRQLTSDQRAMEEKLQAARSNNRFLDKRIAGLEAQLLDAGISGRT
jgi:chromosome segregation ATPase